MAKTEPIWDVDWEEIYKYAHGFGVGPVKVYVRPPKRRYKSPTGDKEFEKVATDNMAVVGANAVRLWNQATGIPVFSLAENEGEADIVVNLKPNAEGPAIPGTQNTAAGTGSPVSLLGGGPSEGSVNLYGEGTQESYVLAHELGHAAGLDHPDTPKTRKTKTDYGDPRLLMSGGYYPAPAEANRVRDLTHENVVLQTGMKGAHSLAEEERHTPEKRRKKPPPKPRGHK